MPNAAHGRSQMPWAIWLSADLAVRVAVYRQHHHRRQVLRLLQVPPGRTGRDLVYITDDKFITDSARILDGLSVEGESQFGISG